MHKRKIELEDGQIYKQAKLEVESVQKEWNYKNLADFPAEVLLLLFSHVDTDSLLEACRVCKRWLSLASDNSLWKLRFHRASINEQNLTEKEVLSKYGSWKNLYVRELLYMDTFMAERNLVIGTGSKGFYLYPDHERSLIQQTSNGPFMKYLGSETIRTWRDNEALLYLVKCAQYKSEYKDLEIVSIPFGVEYKVCKHPQEGFEWIEEIHRTWKGDRSQRYSNKLHTELNARKRHVVIDVGGHDGLGISTNAIGRLKQLTKCYNENHLRSIPRDHPALLQVLSEMKENAGHSLQIVSLPVEVHWFLASKHGMEYVTESYRRWPTPTLSDMKEFPNAILIDNRLVSNMMTRQEWDSLKDQFNVGPMSETEYFSSITQQLEQLW